MSTAKAVNAVSDDVVYSVEEREKAAEQVYGRDSFTSRLNIQCALNRAESHLAAQGRGIEEARELLTPDVVFSGGRDADQCHWCRRDIVDTRLPPEDAHNADCAYLLWLARNQPQEVNDGK